MCIYLKYMRNICGIYKNWNISYMQHIRCIYGKHIGTKLFMSNVCKEHICRILHIYVNSAYIFHICSLHISDIILCLAFSSYATCMLHM